MMFPLGPTIRRHQPISTTPEVVLEGNEFYLCSNIAHVINTSGRSSADQQPIIDLVAGELRCGSS